MKSKVEPEARCGLQATSHKSQATRVQEFKVTRDGVQVLTEANELGAVQAALQDADVPCSGTLVNIPLSTVECSDDDLEANVKAIDRLEELDDVTDVEHNMQVA